MSESEFRDACTEALAWIIACSTSDGEDGLAATLDRSAVYSPFVVELLSVLRSNGPEAAGNDLDGRARGDSPLDTLLLYESYLAVQDPRRRLDRGVFYTPRVVARHIIDRIDTTLREQFGLADGLADTTTWDEMRRRCPALEIPPETCGDEPFVRILDPAAGSGMFLVEVVDRIHHTLRTKWQAARLDEKDIAARWNAYVSRHLLTRVCAVELMPTPSVISQIVVAQKLAATGYDFQAGQRLQFAIADTLLDPLIMPQPNGQRGSAHDAAAALSETLSGSPFTVVLGNPPFRGISSNPSSWIGKLLRGTGPGHRPTVSYYEVDGKPLRERKLWLQDDYVKFFRYAQWQIERAGVGVVGFVTNHGYLDNATFRGMRHAILQTFQQIEVFDLHGNRKKNKAAPGGGTDEGMFEVEQGVAIGIFSRTTPPAASRVTHREVWGKREAKALALEDDQRTAKTRIAPQSPNYLFVPRNGESHPEYEAGFALNDIMPAHSTAVVTARDSFVVGFDKASLAERMLAFCDSSIPDGEIRSRFFTNSRSTKYPPGDTRGWKLPDARRRMMQEPDWRSLLRPCLYRPFDRRFIFWAGWMIDWPRPEITRHMLARPNIALVARRQMPPTGPCSYFWITDTIALDGLIRSDNRGSESVFPLWLDKGSAAGQANLAPHFVDQIATRLGLTWDEYGESTAENRFSATDVLHYIYGLFSATTYRTRYSDHLRADFPRILLPKCGAIWTALRDIGKRLAELHLTSAEIVEPPTSEAADTLRLGAGYPKFAENQIWLAPTGPAVPASRRVWNFQVGTHQVCRKWLRDRGSIDAQALERYQQIVAAIAETNRWMDRTDATVAKAGGWDAVFSA